MDISKRYNKNYFDWYKKIGDYGAILNKQKFSKFIEKEDIVLDFGCGNGKLLENIDCKEKYGVEINDTAIKEAEKKFKIFKSSADLPESKFDVIISNQVLQHCENPREELKNLNRSLKSGGKLILYVLCAGPALKYEKNDINFQMYSWSPMNLGHLLTSCEFDIIKTKIEFSRWPPKYDIIYKIFGIRVFNFLSKLYGYFYKNKMSLCMAFGKKIVIV